MAFVSFAVRIKSAFLLVTKSSPPRGGAQKKCISRAKAFISGHEMSIIFVIAVRACEPMSPVATTSFQLAVFFSI